MTADENTHQGAGSARTDKIGKVFIALNQDMRQCLICESVFTWRAVPEHSMVLCMPGIIMKRGSKLSDRLTNRQHPASIKVIEER
jgi:hypothetical protein